MHAAACSRIIIRRRDANIQTLHYERNYDSPCLLHIDYKASILSHFYVRFHPCWYFARHVWLRAIDDPKLTSIHTDGISPSRLP